MISIEAFEKHIEWSTNNKDKGGQTVSVFYLEITGAASIINTSITSGYHRSIMRNKVFILAKLYEIYKELEGGK
jgi:hypothetical protein